MRKTNAILLAVLLAALLIYGMTLISCDEVFTPANKVISADKMAKLDVTFSQIPLTPGENEVTSCCNSPASGQGDPSVILDNNPSTFWGSNYNAAFPSEDFYGPHWVNIDLGMQYTNVSKIEYVPIWRWDEPGGYDGSWVSGGPAGVVNNGIVTQFEVYLTDRPILKGDVPPADHLVGYGNWNALESTANSIITPSLMKFTATFNSAKGRYLQFRMLSGYRNHWASGLSMIAQISELKVYRTDRPYTVNMEGLKDLVNKANVLRANFLPNYGYTNAILNNWAGKAQSYIDNPQGVTDESIQYVKDNLSAYVKFAGQRIGMNTYDRFVQKILWADDKGNNLQAHGGGILWDPVTGKWWFYGEDRTTNVTGGGQPGVHAYSSTDMYNWKDEGMAFPIFNNTAYDEPNWREASCVPGSGGYPGGWDGNRRNPSGINPPASDQNPPVTGFMWAVNYWRKTLGDWNCDGYITPGGEYYPNGHLTNVTNANSYVTDPVSNLRGPMSKEEQDKAWNAIKDYIPKTNEPLYLWQDTKAKPYATSMGLTEAKVNELNDMYRDIPVWRRKQMYRFWNWTSTLERPKVIYNGGQGLYKMGAGKNAVTGNDIVPYVDATGTYPYVMFVHIEGGTPGISYGTAKVAIAVAKQPAGPFKLVWAYHVNFVEGISDNTDNMGMTRDQSAFVDDNGTAYQFGSTQENRVMCISIMDETYTRPLGVPLYSTGESSDQMLEEGYNNRLGHYFNWVYGNQREAPAPFLHYTTQNMTYEGIVADDGTISGPPQNSAKYYYCASSTSTGWFPNPQGIYRTSRPGDPILGTDPHDKPAMGSTVNNLSGLTAGTAPGTTSTSGTAWITVAGNAYTTTGSTTSFFFGQADDGSYISKGYDGQTTFVQQLRYPKYVWDIIGFLDDGYVAPDVNIFDTPETYLAELKRMYSSGQYMKPVYGQTEIIEPRAGKLVWGKYIHLSDSWDSSKNYDARFIWLPMRVIQGTAGGTIPANTAAGARARWMTQWRWEDYVYDLGPFAGSLTAAPPAIKDSTGGTSASMWTSITSPQNLTDYYNMLDTAFGSSADWFQNPGKQNPGQYQEWLDWINN